MNGTVRRIIAVCLPPFGIDAAWKAVRALRAVIPRSVASVALVLPPCLNADIAIARAIAIHSRFLFPGGRKLHMLFRES